MIKKDRALLVIMTVGLSLMLILRDISGVGINKFIYLVFIVGCMLLANYETLVSMTCFILPLVCGLPSTYIMLATTVLLILKRGRVQLTSIFLIVSLSILEIVASFWYPNVDATAIVQYISYMAILILLIHNTAELDYTQSIRMYLYGILLLCAVIVTVTIQNAPRNWMELFARGAFRFGVLDKNAATAMALSLNANSLAYYSITGIACGIFMAERSKGAARFWYIAIAVFSAVAGFFTVSRSWLLVASMSLLLYIISKLRSPKQFLALAGVLAMLAVIGAIAVNRNPTLLDGFISRFAADDVETGGYRSQIFERFMRYYFGDPRYILFGTGVTNYMQVLKTTTSLHNGTQQILVCTGLVGFALYMFALVGPILRARRQPNSSFARWLPLLGVVVFVQSVQFLNPTMLMLPYVIGVYALRIGGQEHENISDNRGHGGGRPVALDPR